MDRHINVKKITEIGLRWIAPNLYALSRIVRVRKSEMEGS
jgi:hypothetical protein